MKLAAIIAEYNPFHNGHLYHIEETKKRTGADGILVLMSGCFVQRGEPAVYDKFVRARMALEAGADLVLELPTAFACGSAEYFAEGAIRLLNGLRCVDYLSFGCESDRLTEIRLLAHILCEEPQIYRDTLRAGSKNGVSFAAARAAALKAALPDNARISGLDELLSSPNATLALEYCKALERTGSSIIPILIPRKGSGYHETDLTDRVLPSATAIRGALASGRSLSDLQYALPHTITAVPSGDLRPIFPDDASVLLNDRIARLPDSHDILDLSAELTARILRLRRSFYSWTEWCQALKSRQYTYTRVSRALCHILLDIRRSDAEALRLQPESAYARILGLRRDSAVPALLRRHAQIPLITKLADYEKSGFVSCNAKKQLETDLRARDLYRLLYWQKYQETTADEYRMGIVIR